MHALIVGIGLGAGVAVQVGPMSLFLIRNTLRNGWTVGLAVGTGIALVDGLYAAAGAAGVAPLLDVGPLRLILGAVGALVLISLGVRTLYSAWRVRAGGEFVAESATARRAFLTALGARVTIIDQRPSVPGFCRPRDPGSAFLPPSAARHHIQARREGQRCRIRFTTRPGLCRVGERPP